MFFLNELIIEEIFQTIRNRLIEVKICRMDSISSIPDRD